MHSSPKQHRYARTSSAPTAAAATAAAAEAPRGGTAKQPTESALVGSSFAPGSNTNNGYARVSPAPGTPVAAAAAAPPASPVGGALHGLDSPQPSIGAPSGAAAMYVVVAANGGTGPLFQ